MVFRASRRRGSVAGVKFVPDHDELENVVKGLQSQGKVVVLTSGTFDLLHVGHLRCLRDARSRGDFLVLAVQSDRAVRRHRHASLPIIPEKERVELLEALDCVDYVTLFHEESTEKLLLELKPNIYAMGTDYKANTIPERETVLSYGGRILIVGDPKKHSTTEILQRVKSLRRVPVAGKKPAPKSRAKAKARTSKAAQVGG
jgi:rfaE bifunctional protein nucleotidyltransferase chain/domain